ncbi:MAG: IS91 family transposase [Sulfuritalea sp.]|nr:IS91 family transposase [Sulfuritalea sp.]
MTRLAHIIDAFGDDFRAQYRDRLTADHLRALAAITHCRTEASPKMQVACTACDHRSLVPHSCGHRHCPHCQHHESQQWLERQMQRLVPADYFLVTFTLPAQFRPLAAAHPRIAYDLLMKSAWETVRTFSQNDRQLAGTPGAIAVLHTHSRRLDYHPHVHLVVPAAAVDAEKALWRTKRRRGKGFLFSHKALAKVFRAKMLDSFTSAGLTLPARYPADWVVDCKSVGTGASALIYLGRYLYRGVIREQDIVACRDGQVTFRYRHAKTGRMERRTLAGADFLWLVLQHVLPKGFRRARNFGFLHPNCKRLIALLHLLLKFVPVLASALAKERAPIPCPCCGALMRIVRTRIPPTRAGGLAIPPVVRRAL